MWWWIGYLAITVGAVMTFWAWHADRSHGRRRCPKCWYAMTGAPTLRCPECGHDAGAVRRLYRTRRSRWGIAFGLVLMVSGLGGPFAKDVHDHGWAGASPTWALTMALPYAPGAVLAEIDQRLAGGSVSARQTRRIFRSGLGFVEARPDSDQRNAALLVCAQSLNLLYQDRRRYTASFVRRPREWLTDSEVQRVRGLVWSIVDADPRQASVDAIGHVLYASGSTGSEQVALVMPLIEIRRGTPGVSPYRILQRAENSSALRQTWTRSSLDHETNCLYEMMFRGDALSDAFRQFCHQLRDCDGDVAAVRRAATEALTSPDPATQVAGAYVLTVLATAADELCDLAHLIADAPRRSARRCAAWWIAGCPSEQDALANALLARLLDDPAIAVRMAAMHAAMQRGVHTDAIDVSVTAIMREVDADTFAMAIECLNVLRHGRKRRRPLSPELIAAIAGDDDVDFLRSALHFLASNWDARQDTCLHDIVRGLTDHDDDAVAQLAEETLGLLGIEE